MASTPSFFRNSRRLSAFSAQRPARTDAHSWRLLIELSLSAKSSTSCPTAPNAPSSVANEGPWRTATCSKFRHFVCTSRLLVMWSSCKTDAHPSASVNAAGTHCTSWNNADRPSNCTFRRCSWLHCRCSGVPSCASSTVFNKNWTKPHSTAISAQACAEQQRARVPQSNMRNSMSSCAFVSTTMPPPPDLVALLRFSTGKPLLSPVRSGDIPASSRNFRCGSPRALLSKSANKPVLAKRGRFSSRLEMYINNTIMSLRKILSLKR
mmetsp:Transcript_24789/g.70791  ORF Transcript_24789/g.70791 Transcript_24789/m.70791 type:complete len:265 (+) Transcript_24789:1238-2032(+)